jgi:hypothetical protein
MTAREIRDRVFGWLMQPTSIVFESPQSAISSTRTTIFIADLDVGTGEIDSMLALLNIQRFFARPLTVV